MIFKTIDRVGMYVLALFLFLPSLALAGEVLDISNLKSREISSVYFDRAMGYQNSRFRAVSLVDAISRIDSGSGMDALILRCRDDYEGIISFDEIRRYNLQLATEIKIDSQFKRPSWLQAGLLLVPDGSDAPSMERFMTANIEKILPARSAEYFAPLDEVGAKHPEAVPGIRVYKQNCIFCHRLKGVGGNKGGALLEKFDFSSGSPVAMETAFLNFHHKMNEDKQNVEQFVSRSALHEVGVFLSILFSDSR
jgi:mono/diheme cytochrome c family protein